MATPVVLGHDLDVVVVEFVVAVAVLDAQVWKVHLVVGVRQVVVVGPAFDLFIGPIGPAVALAVAPVPLLEEPLVLSLQVPIKLDADDGRAALLEPLCGLQVRAVDLRVMAPLARLVGAFVEGLAAV